MADADTRRMLEAVAAGDVAEVERLVAADPGLASARGPDGISAILLARYRGHAWLAERLAEPAAELDQFEAAALGHVTRLRELLARDAAAAGSFAADGYTPLHLAAFFGQLEAAAVLLERGADPRAAAHNPSRVQPLHSAAAAGHAAIVGLLLERGADPDALQAGGYTPLHAAAANGDVVSTRLLLDHGAARDVCADDGREPVDLAREAGHDELLAALGAEPRPAPG
jgi:uncharacterized protein